MNSYGPLADCYDGLTWDVDYSSWADYLERHFARNSLEVHSVLDLGCGTGSLTVKLAQRGYKMTGVDLSEDMLAVAADKCMELENRPLLLRQDMSRLTLMEPVDAAVCCLDSLNYVIRPAAVQRTFRKVFHWLNPGGIFLFDIRTPEFLRSMDGEVLLDENEDVFCVWRGSYSSRRRILSYSMDLFFREERESWGRAEELHEEYAYEPGELEHWLKDAGFSKIRQYGDRKLRPPNTGEARIFFVAIKEKTNKWMKLSD